MDTQKTIVLVLEPSPLFRMALTEFILKKAGYEIILQNAVEDIQLHPDYPNVGYLIIDVSQQTKEAIAVCKVLKKGLPDLKILATDSNIRAATARKCFFNQLDGYIGKNATIEEFREALQTIKGGEQYVQNRLRQQFVNIMFGKRAKTVRGVTPTNREMEVLRLIINEHTTSEIAVKLFISKCTVETHRLNLLHKFNVKNTAGLVREGMFLLGREAMS